MKSGASGIRLATLAKRDRNLCHICKQFVPIADRSRDHIVPLSWGGSTASSNLALAHRKCNSERGSEPTDTRITKRGWRKPPKHSGRKVRVHGRDMAVGR